jgi:sphingolipid 4-desaturase/C4-monooxygenase
MDDSRFHRRRREAILRETPEIKLLFGNYPRTAWYAGCLVIFQFAIAGLVAERPWWMALIAAFAIGAFVAHYLNVIIHECSHNLVFRDSRLNKILAILVNLPALAPSAIAFRHYHLLHHRFMGRRGLDADVAPPWEVRVFGRSRFGKLIWLIAQPLTYSLIHPLQVKRRIVFDWWLLANIAMELMAIAAVAVLFGPISLLYLALSSYFAVGPHPTGAHIIQEHFMFEGDDETTSYYGPMNAVSINHGLHLEHHDFPTVAGPRLSELRRIAPRHYIGRFQHRSRLVTIWRFIMDREIALDTRAIRAEEDLHYQTARRASTTSTIL